MDNKVKYGLKNVYYSVITLVNNVPNYATPVNIPGAVNISLASAGEKVKFSADDVEDYFNDVINNGYDGNLEMALVSDEFRRDVLSDIIDTNGALIENANAKIKKFALMFEFDGDANKTRHVLYNVLATRPDIESATRANNKDPKTEALKIEARPAVDTSDVKAKVKQGDTGYDAFFSAVYLKNSVVNTAGSNPTEFSKGAPANVEFTTTSNGTTAVKNVLFNGAPIPGVSLTIAALKVTINKEFVSGLSLAIGNYPIVCEFTKGNSVTYILTVKA